MLANELQGGDQLPAPVSLAVVLADLRSRDKKRFYQDLKFIARTTAAVEQLAAIGAADPDSARQFEDTTAFAIMKLRRLRQKIRRARLGTTEGDPS